MQVANRMIAARLFRALAATTIALLCNGCDQKRTAAPNAHPVTHELLSASGRYAVADVFLKESTLQLYWKKPDGSRVGTFRNLDSVVSASGNRLLFATNAGIFDSNFTPVGLFVEDGQILVPLNLNSGSGNFYLKPNGVFLINGDGAAIIESSAYTKRSVPPRLATQSGPLLVINGQINSQFAADSTNRKIRSGVGIVSANHIVFALSRDRVTFFEFASLFRDELHCQNALYLDGEISRFYPDRADESNQEHDFAGVFAVTAKP